VTEAATPWGRRTARILLDIKAVNFRPDEPYTLTSGRLSPVYIDCRKIISYPAERRAITEMAADLIRREIGVETLDVVGGGETAGISFAAWIAEALDLPMVYVRKKPKGFGRMAQIEGDLAEGARVLLVEDLATDGGSKVQFCEAIRKAGARVAHAFVVFHYAIFPASVASLRAIGVTLHALATWRDVIAEARRGGDFDDDALRKVEAFLDNPESWMPAKAAR
jgi:orotate phosphoribosyltransferase